MTRWLGLVVMAVLLLGCRTSTRLRSFAANDALGTAHPFFLQRVSRAGDWVVACQARADTDGDGKVEVRVGHHGNLSGDEPRPYLFLQAGDGEPLEELGVTDETERWLIVRAGGKLVLIDTQTRVTTQLSGEATSRGESLSAQLDFDPASQRLVFLRAQGSRLVAVVRSIRSGEETVVDPGVDGAVTVSFVGARHLLFSAVLADTDGDGQVRWPQVQTTMARGACVGRALSASWYGRRGDAITRLLLPVAGGPSRRLEANELPLGELVLAYEPKVGVRVGTEERLGVACAPTLAWLDPPRGRALFRCEAAEHGLRWVDARGATPVAASLAPSEQLRAVRGSSWLLGSDGLALDLTTNRVRKVEGWLEEATGNVSLWRDRASSEEEPVYLVLDAQTGTSVTLRTKRPPETWNPRFLTARWVVLEGIVYDRTTGKPFGRSPEGSELFAENGLFLVLEGPSGPARWVAPSPP